MSATRTNAREERRVSPDAAGRLSSSEAAEILGVSQATVTRLPREQLPYATTPKGHRRYRREDVERYRDWLENGDHEPRA